MSRIRSVRWGVPVRKDTCPGPSALWGRVARSFPRRLYLPSVSTRSPFTAGWTVNGYPTIGARWVSNRGLRLSRQALQPLCYLPIIEQVTNLFVLKKPAIKCSCITKRCGFNELGSIHAAYIWHTVMNYKSPRNRPLIENLRHLILCTRVKCISLSLWDRLVTVFYFNCFCEFLRVL